MYRMRASRLAVRGFVARHGLTLMLVRLHKGSSYVCSSYSTFKLVLSVSTDELKCECDEIKANALQDWPSRAENSARENQPVDGGSSVHKQ